MDENAADENAANHDAETTLPAKTPTSDTVVASDTVDGADPANESKSARSALQFSLFELMAITTGASIAAAVASVRGLPSLVLSTCTLTTLANCAGRLARWQTPAWQRKWVYLGWLLFLVSLGLPAVKGCDDKYVYGWNLAGGLAAGEAEGVWKLATSREAWSEFFAEPADSTQAALLFTSLNLLNLTLLALPLAAWYWRRNSQGSGRATTVWVTCLLLGGAWGWGLSWADDNRDGLLVGYYVWSAAILVVVSHRRLPWKSLLAVIGFIVFLASLDWFDG